MSYLFEMLLLSSGEVEHLFGILDQHCTLRLGLGDVETTSKHGNFRLWYSLYVTYVQRFQRKLC